MFTLTEAVMLSALETVRAFLEYQKFVLEKVPAQAELLNEQAKPFLALQKAINKVLGVSDGA